MSDYEALKAYGHSAPKAAEIALDAKRGDGYAVAWVAASRASRPNLPPNTPKESTHEAFSLQNRVLLAR